MLFHLAHPFLAGQKRIQVETALERLNRHGRGNYNDYTLELTFPPNPDGLYLLTRAEGAMSGTHLEFGRNGGRGRGSLPAALWHDRKYWPCCSTTMAPAGGGADYALNMVASVARSFIAV
jgi:hypothetical protein